MTMTETTQNTTGHYLNAHLDLWGSHFCLCFTLVFTRHLAVILRGSALQKRLRDREKETELDERDRKREKEELEEIRQRLLAEGHPDPDAELQRVSQSLC